MAAIFWDYGRILFIDNKFKEETITGAHYVEILTRLWKVIKLRIQNLADLKNTNVVNIAILHKWPLIGI